MSIRKSTGIAILLAAMTFCGWSRAGTTPTGTSFTYQGMLKQDGFPANGAFHLRFQLWDAQADGTQVGADVNHPTTNVVDGLFAVALDFGSLAFNGEARWLQVQVITGRSGGVTVTTLTPRQPIHAAPYALFAIASDGAGLTNLNASNLVSGTMPAARLPTGGAWTLTSALTLASGTLHVDPSSQRVGIGTATPASDLHVVGNTTLAGDVVVTGGVAFASVPQLPVTSRTISVNPAAFVMRAGSSSAFHDFFDLYTTAPQNNTVHCLAPLSLPDGAVITDVTFVLFDLDSTRQFICSLMRDDAAIGDSGDQFTTIGSGTSLSSSSAFQGVSISGLPHTVDNTGHSYVLSVTWQASISSFHMRLRRVEVTYTITSPLP